MPSFGERLKNSWNAFLGRDPTTTYNMDIGVGSGYRPDRIRLTRGNERSIVTSIYNRIAMDVASMKIEHVYTDDQGNFTQSIDSRLNECLTLSANIDQISTAFVQDICMSMFDEGVVAIVPTDTTANPLYTDSYDIYGLRTAKILEWYPKHVRVRLYNDNSGRREDIILPKGQVAIVENPLYAVMNEPNSTVQRLIRTISNIDKINADTASGKLDMIIQLPYLTKTKTKQEQAEHRRKKIEEQLIGSKYGIAYIDGSEKIVQLNKSLENNLWTQYKDLCEQIFQQLGMSQAILDGSADEKQMINYYNRTIDPILDAITKEMKRKFLSPNARSRGQDILYFRDPFKIVPASELADIADKLTRNEILSSNEVRAEIGYKPVDDPKADQLINKNINQTPEQTAAMNGGYGVKGEEPYAPDYASDGADVVQQLLEDE